MGLDRIQEELERGWANAKSFAGRTYRGVSKFATGIDKYADIMRQLTIGIAPIAGSLSGPVGSAVGTGLSVLGKGLSTYDNLKNEALGQVAQAGKAINAGMRGITK